MTIAQTEAKISENNQILTWIGKTSVGPCAPEGTLSIMSGQIVYTSEEIQQLNQIINMKSLDQENIQLKDYLLEKKILFEEIPSCNFCTN
jgi:hypothetical protein|tara:strand:- start:290 stop:559 length:270 start_codon:yes stop_codon:yes gene_type:complete